jgi:hypothetical protein
LINHHSACSDDRGLAAYSPTDQREDSASAEFMNKQVAEKNKGFTCSGQPLIKLAERV